MMVKKSEQRLFAGKYQVQCRIGEGGMCEVFRALHTELQREVALKILRADLAEEKDERERFLREARTCAQLEHPNIVQVFEVGEAKSRPYMAIEYVDGGSLKELNDKRISLQESLRVAKEVVHALEAAHEMGILHRDLKPENILVAKDGAVKVADWGLAKGLEDKQGLTRAGMVLGTPQYISPDQIKQKGVTPSADLYSLGVIIFESASGKLPFKCSSVFEFLQAHLKREPPKLHSLLPIVPRELDDLVNSLLAKEPAERPPSARAVASALDGILASFNGKKAQNVSSPMELSVAEGPVLARQKGTVKLQQQPPKEPAKRIWPVLLVLLLLATFSFVYFKSGASGAVAQKEKLDIKSVSLSKFDEISLRYSGGKQDDVVIVEIEGEPSPITLQLSRGRSVAKDLFELRYRLAEPMLKAGKIKVGNAQFLLSPSPLVDNLLEPIEELKGRKAQRLLNELSRLRDHFERLRRTSAVSKRQVNKAVEDVLDGYGLGKQKLAQLAWLPPFIKKGTLPGSAFARKLLPLRRINLVLADMRVIEPPWGWLDETLGVTLSPNYNQPHFKLPWRSLKYVDLSKMVKVAHGKRRLSKKLRLWMTYPEHFVKLKDSVTRTTFSSLIFEGTLVQQSEVGPRRASDIVTEKSIDFDLQIPRSLLWPPKEASLDFNIKAFGRQLSLGVRLNDGPLCIIMNGKTLGRANRQQAFFTPQWVTVPIAPDQLKEGRNTINLSVEQVRPLRWTYDIMAIDGFSVVVKTSKK